MEYVNASASSSFNQSAIESINQQISQINFILDEFYLYTMGIFISLMQIGFGLLEVGAVRSKNSTNVMMKNMMDSFLCGIVYWLFGFTLAFGTGNSFAGLYPYVAGYKLAEKKMFAKWYFELSYASTPATIVSGAVAERCHFIGYLVYSSLISCIVYPIVCHWAWTEEGWLKQLGFQDFCGSSVVHMCGGCCAIVAAILLGPRYNRWDKKNENDSDENFNGHSSPISALGAMLLFTTFLAFNAGSVLHISQPGDVELIVKIIIVSLLSTCGCATTTLFISKAGGFNPTPFKGHGYWSFYHTANAGLMGLVISCASADSIELWASLVLGSLGAFVYLGLHHLTRKLKVDDVINVIPVHFGGGLWGILASPLLKNDALPGLNGTQAGIYLGYNIIGMLAIAAWSMGCALIIFVPLKMMGLLRSSEHEEIIGMDAAKHNEPAYQYTIKDIDLGEYKKLIETSGNLTPTTPQIFNFTTGGRIPFNRQESQQMPIMA
ncbi:putative ammonium transporter 1 [Cloeon dipterum]|uniref:putative ammonium transporter 1 n=1 Tax=Cloeon dipterum TaxID=197152 RepID=UPI00321F7BF6